MEHVICRSLYKTIIADIEKEFGKKELIRLRKESWAWKDGNTGKYEFQLPSEDIYWYGQACCSWEAKYSGWAVFMRKRNVEGY